MTDKELESLDTLLLTNTRVQLLIKTALVTAGVDNTDSIITEMVQKVLPGGMYQKGHLLRDTRRNGYCSRHFYDIACSLEEQKRAQTEACYGSDEYLNYGLSTYVFGYLSEGTTLSNDIPFFFPSNINMLNDMKSVADNTLQKKLEDILDYRSENKITIIKENEIAKEVLSILGEDFIDHKQIEESGMKTIVNQFDTLNN